LTVDGAQVNWRMTTSAHTERPRAFTQGRSRTHQSSVKSVNRRDGRVHGARGVPGLPG
jgi:hypothetical protein